MRISSPVPSTDSHRIPAVVEGDVPVFQAFKLVLPITAKQLSFTTSFNEQVRLRQACSTGNPRAGYCLPPNVLLMAVTFVMRTFLLILSLAEPKWKDEGTEKTYEPFICEDCVTLLIHCVTIR
jgi:hypothetical protein